MPFCTKCGTKLNDAITACPRCGAAPFRGHSSSGSGAASEASAGTFQPATSHPSQEVFRALARCSLTKQPFLVKIRRLQKDSFLVLDASPIDEARSRNPSFRAGAIEGWGQFSQEYKGCPRCGDQRLLVCSCCGKGLACSGRPRDRKLPRIQTCPWCGQTGLKMKATKLRLRASAD